MILPELWILRHGETEWNVAGRLQGGLDSALTMRGERQAEAQNAILRAALGDRQDVAIFSSPQGRAMRTAERASQGLSLCLQEDNRLREVALGDWQGRTLEQVAAVADMTPPLLWKLSAPGGERLDQLIARCEAVLADLTGPTVLVTHGVTSRCLRGLVLGQAPDLWAELPGGQGVVHHLKDGKAQVLTAPFGACG